MLFQIKCRIGLVICVFIMSLFLLTSCLYNEKSSIELSKTSKGKKTFYLGTGSKSGTYYKFGEHLSEISSEFVNVDVVVTEGSYDNLERMKVANSSGRIDAAIVQNDIAYKAYSGRNNKKHIRNDSFRSALPLFREYLLLIVNKSSDIQSLYDLKGPVWIGEKGSGTRRNALRVINEIDYRSKLTIPSKKPCEFPSCLTSKKIQAVFFTRSSVPNWFNNKDFRLVSLPLDIVSRIIDNTPYFIRADLPSSGGDENKGETLSVLSYLVIGKHVNRNDAELLTNTILNNYNDLNDIEESYTLLELGDKIGFLPVPRHIGAEKALVDRKLIADPSLQWWWFVFALIILGILWRIHKESISYDMLGGRKKHTNLAGWLIKKFDSLYIYTVVIIISIFLYTASLWVLRSVEERYAIENNTQSPLSDISFSKAILWMFVFTGTGETDNKFPQSVVGKLLVTSFPFLGGLSFIGLLAIGYFQRREKLLSMSRGRYISPMKGHILICGWNKKAPGIIYGLTSSQAPSQYKVVVVAELGSDTPLAEYDFDHRLVSYCNGDSSDISVLSRAYVNNASHAIILAGINKRQSKNIQSIITAQAVKHQYASDNKIANDRMNKKNDDSEIFVISELLYQDNKKRFEASNTDILVDAETFSNRLLSSVCFGGDVASFILDILTFDYGAALYLTESEKKIGSELQKTVYNLFTNNASTAYSWVGWRLDTLRCHLMAEGVNLIGISCSARNEIKLVFKEPDYQLLHTDKLLYLAIDQDVFLKSCIRKRNLPAPVEPPVSKLSTNSIFTPSSLKILFIGDWNRCNSISQELSRVKYVDFSAISSNAPKELQEDTMVYRLDPEEAETWDEIPFKDFNRIVILAQNSLEGSEKNLFEDKGELDANTLFIANSLKKYISLKKLNNPPKIIAEMQNQNFSSLFNSCVDTVIPSTMFIERLLINAVYHRGNLGGFITSLLSQADGTFLISHIVKDGDEFFMIAVEQLFSWIGSKRQILGYQPKKHRDVGSGLEFWVTPADIRASDEKVQAGDIIIMIYSA